MVALANPFGSEERTLWAPPEDLSTTEWADRYRVLSDRVSALAGPYRSERVPYARGIMDALSDPAIREVFFQKPVQCGGSELGRNWLGRSCDLDPAPFMIVFPSKEACSENMVERVIPMFSDSPRLQRLSTGRVYDKSKSVVHLRSCSIYGAYSGSPQSVASRPIARALCDELDKWSRWRGKEGDPLGLVRARLYTYRYRSKLYGLSTPTVPNGPICRAIAACGDVRDYWVRCIRCHELQLPDWKRVHWEGKKTDQDEDAFRLRKRQLEAGEVVATYECEHCEAKLTQEQWWFGVELGEWVSVGYPPGVHPKSETVGFRLSGLASPWIGVQRVALEFVSAQLEGLGALQNFFNSVLGLPFWSEGTHGDATQEVTQERIYAVASSGGPRFLCPDWTQGVAAGIDSGKVGHQFTIRAFGLGYRSQLLDYGEFARSSDVFPLLDRKFHGQGGQLFEILGAALDVGGGRGRRRDQSRTEELLQLCEKDARLHPIKGHGGAGRLGSPIKQGKRLTLVDTGYWKDVTASEINGEIWHAFPGVSADYVQQVASERKVLVETKVKPDGTTEEVWRWVVRAAGRPNHFWDCEIYTTVMARILKLGDQVVSVEYDYNPPEEGGYESDDGGWEPPERFWERGKW